MSISILRDWRELIRQLDDVALLGVSGLWGWPRFSAGNASMANFFLTA
jgi:hypothetical protein